jgi:NADH dehydrogenase [ubiquinone] 1 alpha subcomplex assembly factor 1
MDPIELWQHQLFLRTPGQWETVLIPWSDFLRTWNGRISYKKFDGMDKERAKTVGASLIERKEGPFCLHATEIKITPEPQQPPPILHPTLLLSLWGGMD